MAFAGALSPDATAPFCHSRKVDLGVSAIAPSAKTCSPRRSFAVTICAARIGGATPTATTALAAARIECPRKRNYQLSSAGRLSARCAVEPSVATPCASLGERALCRRDWFAFIGEAAAVRGVGGRAAVPRRARSWRSAAARRCTASAPLRQCALEPVLTHRTQENDEAKRRGFEPSTKPGSLTVL